MFTATNAAEDVANTFLNNETGEINPNIWDHDKNFEKNFLKNTLFPLDLEMFYPENPHDDMTDMYLDARYRVDILDWALIDGYIYAGLVRNRDYILKRLQEFEADELARHAFYRDTIGIYRQTHIEIYQQKYFAIKRLVERAEELGVRFPLNLLTLLEEKVHIRRWLKYRNIKDQLELSCRSIGCALMQSTLIRL